MSSRRDNELKPRQRGSPSEALMFARAILGESASPVTRPRQLSAAEREQLQWLEAIAPERARNVRQQCYEQLSRQDREQLEWLAAIAPDQAWRLRDLLREEPAMDDEYAPDLGLFQQIGEDWDESKHPRLGGPPNAGWFASTGGEVAASVAGDGRRNRFGVWPDRPAGYRAQPLRTNGMSLVPR